MSQESMENTQDVSIISGTNLVDIDFAPFCNDNNEIIAWTLQKQAELRMELTNFYKKEFMEIHASVVTIEPDATKQDELMSGFMAHYKELWEATFFMLDTES